MSKISNLLKKYEALFLFIVSFIIYLKTLAPSIFWGDSSELIASAYTLGIAHPTGYPLYVLLGKLFTFLPFGTIAYRLNLMSALFGALAATLLYFVALKITKNRAAAIFSSLTLALSYTFWNQATIAEVYTLHALFVVSLILLLLKWKENTNMKYLYSFCFLFGLGLTNHVTLILLAPAFGYFIFINMQRKKLIQIKTIAIMLILFIAGLLPYLYLPLRALQQPLLNWGNPITLKAFLQHIMGGGYGNYFKPELIFVHLKSAFYYLLSQFPLTLIFVILGLFSFWKKDKKILLFSGLIVFFNISFNILYDIPDIIVNYIPTYMIFSLFIGYSLYKTIRFIKNKLTIPFYALIIAAIILIAANSLFFLSVPKNHISPPLYINGEYKPLAYTNLFPQNVDKHNFDSTDSYARFIMENAKPNAVIASDFDDVAFPLIYYQTVEGKRKDLIIISKGPVSKIPWYQNQLKEKHPELNLNVTQKEDYTSIEFELPSVMYYIEDNPVFFEKFDATWLNEYEGPKIYIKEMPKEA